MLVHDALIGDVLFLDWLPHKGKTPVGPSILQIVVGRKYQFMTFLKELVQKSISIIVIVPTHLHTPIYMCVCVCVIFKRIRKHI